MPYKGERLPKSRQERVSYAKAVKRVERSSISEGPVVVKTGRPTLQPEYHRQDPEIVHVKKVLRHLKKW